MKKMLVLLIGITLLCTSCTNLPSNTREIINQTDEIKFVNPDSEEIQEPFGNYILIRYYPTGQIGKQQIYVDLVFTNNVVCTWSLGEVQPWERDENILYFTPDEDNCPSLDTRNGVSWYVNSNYAQLKFQENDDSQNIVIQELEIWSMVGSTFYKLEKVDD